MDIIPFELLLKEAIGLDVASIGSSAIDRAVAERQQATGLADRHTYWERLRASEEELQELIDAVVVPETWFFRDRGAFAALAEVALPEWLRTHPHGVFRLLSIPCATGEEPYSLAMALFDANLPAARFQIDAFDVSERALESARRAVYGRRSFRGETSPSATATSNP
jgi:chemotaxis protein methyltransferase WspC